MKFFVRKKDQFKNSPWLKTYKQFDIPTKMEFSKSTLYEKVRETAEKYPTTIAYSYFGTTSTYKKLLHDIDECAYSLKKEGIKSGEVVTICLPNTPEAIIAFYAINKIGAIANMIHPLSSPNEIEHYVTSTNSIMLIAIDLVWSKISDLIEKTPIKKIVLVSVKDSMDLITSIGYFFISKKSKNKIVYDYNVIHWKDLIRKNCQIEEYLKMDCKTPAVILHSGGTTGKSKGIILSSYNFNSVAESEIVVCKDLKFGRTILSVMPIFHGFGLGSTIHAPLIVGSTCILLPQFQAKKFGELLKKHRPNVIAGVPTIYEGLLSSNALKNGDLSYLKCAICGGDSLSKSLKVKVDKFFREHNSSCEVRSAFGMTECVSGVTMMPKNSEILEGIGLPCPGSAIKIVEPSTHDEMPFHEIGEICVSGPSVMIGYLNEPKENAAALQIHEDGKTWLHTGDLGYMDEDGYVYYKQRLKRMIVSSGYNIYPAQIEEVIESHPDVLTCTVIGIDHPYKVQVAKAFIVLKDGVNETFKIKNEIKDLCKENIAVYAQPHDYEFRKSLPTTLVGKVAYRELEGEEKKKREKE